MGLLARAVEYHTRTLIYKTLEEEVLLGEEWMEQSLRFLTYGDPDYKQPAGLEKLMDRMNSRANTEVWELEWDKDAVIEVYPIPSKGTEVYEIEEAGSDK